MQKTVTILVLILLVSCCQNSNTDNKSDIYISRSDFGEVDNQISKNVLDSIINALPYWRLDNFKTTDFAESYAVEFLRDGLRLEGLNPGEFIILGTERENDSTIVFQLNHIDFYVYNYNLDKKNYELSKNPTPDGIYEEIPPITGNVSGYEGWYKIDFVNNKLEIEYAQ